MEPVALTLIATAAEPSPVEAQSHAIKNCVCVILERQTVRFTEN